MRTSKPVSAISYNSPQFLRLKLEELRRAKRISEWYFIEHEPEEDEGGKKRHIHLYLVPSKMLQTDDLIVEFSEFDVTHPEKPLTCPRWRDSKFSDWYLYGIHDKSYLASKGQSRRYHYRYEDVLSFDSDALLQSVREIDLTSLTPVKTMLDAQAQGISFSQYFRSGAVPIPQFLQFKQAWELMALDRTERMGRETHTPRIDEITGEIIETEPDSSDETSELRTDGSPARGTT